MKIEHFGGLAEVGDDASLDEVLSKRFGEDVNEFWISGDEKYPALTIQVRGPLSCLLYYPEEGHPGFISVGEDGDEDEVVVFRTNTPTEEIEVSADAVVPFEQARRAAHEFMTSTSKPASVEWSEL